MCIVFAVVKLFVLLVIGFVIVVGILICGSDFWIDYITTRGVKMVLTDNWNRFSIGGPSNILNKKINVLEYVNAYNALETDSADIMGLLLDTYCIKIGIYIYKLIVHVHTETIGTEKACIRTGFKDGCIRAQII